jgi:hypothetical protein
MNMVMQAYLCLVNTVYNQSGGFKKLICVLLPLIGKTLIYYFVQNVLIAKKCSPVHLPIMNRDFLSAHYKILL